MRLAMWAFNVQLHLTPLSALLFFYFHFVLRTIYLFMHVNLFFHHFRVAFFLCVLIKSSFIYLIWLLMCLMVRWLGDWMVYLYIASLLPFSLKQNICFIWCICNYHWVVKGKYMHMLYVDGVRMHFKMVEMNHFLSLHCFSYFQFDAIRLLLLVRLYLFAVGSFGV